MTSTLVVTVEKDMDSPVHVYYILGDFYQNHKRYVRSVSYDQLHGGNPSGLQDCVPQRWIGSEENASLPQMGQMNPCGLTAWSLFNDSFTDFSVHSFTVASAADYACSSAHGRVGNACPLCERRARRVLQRIRLRSRASTAMHPRPNAQARLAGDSRGRRRPCVVDLGPD